MIAMAGGVERLRPHIKTHKTPEIIQLQLAAGITRFKCATVAEAEMTATAGARDILLAYQPIGPKLARLLDLILEFPAVSFSTIADDLSCIERISNSAASRGRRVAVLLDIDCGMQRAGVAPGPKAIELYQALCTAPGLRPAGLHAYDGHIHDADPGARAKRCGEAMAPVLKFRQELIERGWPVPQIVAGGTPTFPMHAQNPEVECSPGTCVLWDHGYAAKLPDLDFLPAATVLTRVASKPGENRLCLDLGHKAIAAENPPPRVYFPQLPEAKAVGHSEEHLVLETDQAGDFRVGDTLFGIPWHICPTVALHSHATVIENGRAAGQWRITARDRRIRV
jgi:D-serine deaminase-like pyridoxal phosphate-dependent protein